MRALSALSRDVVRELDRRAIEEFGIPSLVLMENAGRAAADEVRALAAADFGAGARGDVVVLCGPGNNGGDGLVVARTLFDHGLGVRAVFVGLPEELARSSADVRTNVRLWEQLGGALPTLASPDDVARLGSELSRAAVIVDGLFGTGLARPLGEPWLGVVRATNAAGRPVLALDLPSGLDADTGDVLGDAVHADVTVTFVAPKLGFERGRGPELVGRLVVAEIGIPRTYLDEL